MLPRGRQATPRASLARAGPNRSPTTGGMHSYLPCAPAWLPRRRCSPKRLSASAPTPPAAPCSPCAAMVRTCVLPCCGWMCAPPIRRAASLRLATPRCATASPALTPSGCPPRCSGSKRTSRRHGTPPRCSSNSPTGSPTNSQAALHSASAPPRTAGSIMCPAAVGSLISSPLSASKALSTSSPPTCCALARSLVPSAPRPLQPSGCPPVSPWPLTGPTPLSACWARGSPPPATWASSLAPPTCSRPSRPQRCTSPASSALSPNRSSPGWPRSRVGRSPQAPSSTGSSAISRATSRPKRLRAVSAPTSCSTMRPPRRPPVPRD